MPSPQIQTQPLLSIVASNTLLSRLLENTDGNVANLFVDRFKDHLLQNHRTNMNPKRSDLDMNHHVNNVKYFNWMLEIIPHKFLENYQLTRMTLEYRRECSGRDVVESLCKPGEESFAERHQDKNVDSLASALFQDGDHRKSYTHLLQTTGDKESAEIVRGRTIWKRKL